MNKIDRYINAATRENTRRSYLSAIEHYEVIWGGFLPATAESVARYLADFADTLTVNTLKTRLAALAQWHNSQGFPDPTKAPVVKKVLKGIKELHPAQEKQAKPLQLAQLNQTISYLEASITDATQQADQATLYRSFRNRALILIGFWRGFRSDELSRLRVDYIKAEADKGMTIYLPRTKTNRDGAGRIFKTPALSHLCPVAAYLDWIDIGRLNAGPVFPKIDRWGNFSQESIAPGSVAALIRAILSEANIDEASHYSSHSLRRGFATWANDNNWTIKELMDYVGWKDVKSAMRYLDHPNDSEKLFEPSLKKLKIENG
jgi:integrase